ncbi:MAG: hypothetical protein WDN06_16460 [Asticcacaulis sp.]
MAQLKEFSQKVRDEDRAICRKVQEGLNALDRPRVMLTGRMEQATPISTRPMPRA